MTDVSEPTTGPSTAPARASGVDRVLGHRHLPILVAIVASLAAIGALFWPSDTTNNIEYPPDAYPLVILKTPVRAIDTREGVTGPLGPVLAGQPMTVDLVSKLEKRPEEVATLILNVTVVMPNAAGVTVVYAGDAPKPLTANFQQQRGEITSNLVFVTPSQTAGTVVFENSNGAANYVVDIIGYAIR